jgi:hypothetical protein
MCATFHAVLRHRLVLRAGAELGATPDAVITDILKAQCRANKFRKLLHAMVVFHCSVLSAWRLR